MNWEMKILPPLHLVDYDRFVKAWKKEGTQRMGIFKGAETGMADDPNSASQVVRRHLSATSPSPLYQFLKIYAYCLKIVHSDTTYLGQGLRL